MKQLPGNLNWRPKRRRKGEAAQPPRPAHSYRGARRNDSRGERRSIALKEERDLAGETRPGMDRRREAARNLRMTSVRWAAE